MKISFVDWSNASHCQAVLELNIQLQAEGFERHNLTLPADQEERLRTLLISDLSALPEIVGFLAFEGEQPVGLMLCRRGYSTYRVRRTIYCEDLWVHPEHRRRGIARSLVEAVIEHGSQMDYARVELTTTANNLAAGKLYLSFGFSCAKEIADGSLAAAIQAIGIEPGEHAVTLKYNL